MNRAERRKYANTKGDKVVLGGPLAKKVWQRGEITCSLEIVNNEESLCMWRTNKAAGNGAAIIGVHCLGHYFDSTGLPSREGMRRVEMMKQVMGFSAMEVFASRKVLDAIYESIHELIHLRPAEPQGIDLTGVEKVVLRANGDVILDL